MITHKCPSAALSIRIDLPGGGRFGPGKAALLGAIAEHGTISAAAAVLGMSYPRALKLIDDMNSRFNTPLVLARHGGADRGGSALSDTGLKILEIYREISASATQQNTAALDQIGDLISVRKD